eukprot:3931847-Rhodomonas_salina.2
MVMHEASERVALLLLAQRLMLCAGSLREAVRRNKPIDAGETDLSTAHIRSTFSRSHSVLPQIMCRSSAHGSAA